MNEGSGFVAGGVSWKNEGGVCEDINPFEWWGCSIDSGGFPERGGIELDASCPNTEERWPPPKTDEVPPKTELGAKGLGVDTRAENAFFGGAGPGSCSGIIPNGEGVDPPKMEETCGGMGSGTVGTGSSPCSVCSTKGCESSSTSISSINSRSS